MSLRNSLYRADSYAITAGDTAVLLVAFSVFHVQRADGAEIIARPAAGAFFKVDSDCHYFIFPRSLAKAISFSGTFGGMLTPPSFTSLFSPAP